MTCTYALVFRFAVLVTPTDVRPTKLQFSMQKKL